MRGHLQGQMVEVGVALRETVDLVWGKVCLGVGLRVTMDLGESLSVAEDLGVSLRVAVDLGVAVDLM